MPISTSRLLDDYAEIARRRGRALVSTALRMRSVAARDVAAHLATDGRMDFGRLRQVLGERRVVPGRQALGDHRWNAEWTADLARLVALQAIDERDLLDAHDLYDHLRVTRGTHRFDAIHAKTYADLLCTLGHDELLDAVLATSPLEDATRRALRADLRNPHRGGPFALDERRWVASFLEAVGMPDAGIGLEPGAGRAIDRLRGHDPVGTVDGPLVTVVVTAYRPDAGLQTAVRSILDQTWANLEVLVVDDGSPASHQPTLHAVADLDERVRLVLKPTNGGTYRARNTAMELARGEFLTFQDSDDWSHPRRIESQIGPLVEDPELIGTRSLCVRATDDLVLTHLGYRPFRPNASSLMIRVQQALGRVGYFDEVRKGADSEYHARLSAVFGREAIRDLRDVPLAVVRRTAGSLSRKEFSPGWRHRARFTYRTSYQRWHRDILEGADAFLPREPDVRPFPAPRRMLDAWTDRATYDVVFAGDWRAFGGPQRSMLEEIRACTRAGLRVGVAHLEALRFMTMKDRALAEPLEDLLHEGTVEMVVEDDEVDIGLLLLRYPPILQFASDAPTRWNVESAWIVANQAPAERDGRDLRYLVEDCDRTARRLFGCDPLWVPQGPTARHALEPFEGLVRISDFDDPGIIDPEEWEKAPHVPDPERRPRVGRYSRDAPMKFPASSDDLREVYDAPDVDVTMMGAVDTVTRMFGDDPIPPTWTLLPKDSVPVVDFLQDVDFFVYYDHPETYEAFGRSILEALASGVVVVLPPHFKPVFGDAALYTRPSEAMGVVRRLHAEPHRFQRQVATSQRVVRERFSHQAFLDRVVPFLPSGDRRAGGSVRRPVREAGPDQHLGGGLLVGTRGTGVTPPGWREDVVGMLTHRWDPAMPRARQRIRAGDRLRDPFDVVLYGMPLDLERPSAEIEVVARRVAEAYGRGGLAEAERYVGYLGGRHLCMIQDGDELVVLPDAFATEALFFEEVAGHFAAGSDPKRVQEGQYGDDGRSRATTGPRRLRANFRLRVDLLGGGALEERFYPWAPLRPVDDVAAELDAILEQHLWALSRLGPVGIELDGSGLDAMMARRVASHLDDRAFAFTSAGGSGGLSADELDRVGEANRVATSLALPHLVLERTGPGPDGLIRRAHGVVLASVPPPVSQTGHARTCGDPSPRAHQVEQVRPLPDGWCAEALACWEDPSALARLDGHGRVSPLLLRRCAELLLAHPATTLDDVLALDRRTLEASPSA